ncbi:MAG TPA: NADH-quinone oxidoreductase subunit J [Chloroflexi bacterium]|nr:NADH-quinone oxidoreductase subunit J [Chloroflexota bacterium]
MTITPVTIAFAVLAIFTLGGGLGVVSSRNMVHAALYLVLALFGVAGLYVLLEAPFLAAIQVLVYMGAIAVLITITIMVTRRIMGITESVNRQWPLAAGIAALVAVTLGFVVLGLFNGLLPVADVPPDNIEQLGAAFVSHQAYLLPFEVASVLLLAAMIGAIVVARD